MFVALLLDVKPSLSGMYDGLWISVCEHKEYNDSKAPKEQVQAFCKCMNDEMHEKENESIKEWASGQSSVSKEQGELGKAAFIECEGESLYKEAESESASKSETKAKNKNTKDLQRKFRRRMNKS